MYSDKNLAYVLTSLEAIEKVFIYTSSFENPDELYWSNDQLHFNAVYNLLIVIGEETRKIETEIKKEFPSIPWQKISGLRNFLAHDYRGIDPEIIFDIVKKYLPELKNILIQIADKIDVDPLKLNLILTNEYYKHINYLLKK